MDVLPTYLILVVKVFAASVAKAAFWSPTPVGCVFVALPTVLFSVIRGRVVVEAIRRTSTRHEECAPDQR